MKCEIDERREVDDGGTARNGCLGKSHLRKCAKREVGDGGTGKNACPTLGRLRGEDAGRVGGRAKVIFYWVILVGIGGLYALAGVLKIANPQALADAIEGYGLPLGDWTTIGALFLPPVEIVCAVALLWKKTRQAGLLLLLALTILFLVALVQAKVRGLDIDCGCFGNLLPGDENVSVAIARDVVFLVGIVWAKTVRFSRVVRFGRARPLWWRTHGGKERIPPAPARPKKCGNVAWFPRLPRVPMAPVQEQAAPPPSPKTLAPSP